MPDPLVLYDVDDKVVVITLNRPDKLNAISAELQQQLTDAFVRADADPVTSVVLLRAEGRSFCAGYDISAREPAPTTGAATEIGQYQIGAGQHAERAEMMLADPRRMKTDLLGVNRPVEDIGG